MPVYLMYHELELANRRMCQVDPGYVRYVVREADFRRQMNWLKNQARYGVSVGQALASSSGDHIVLTFDDGCETDLLTAAPLLRELGFSATFYITVSFLDTRGFLSRSQLRRLSDLGFEIGSHSMTHPHLNDLNAQQLRDEIRDSKAALEQITGRSIEHFSCPGGRWNKDVVEAVRRAGYRSLATSRPAVNPRDSNPFSLGRVVVMRDTSDSEFQQRCLGRGLWQMRVKNSVPAIARHVLGNTAYDHVRERLLR